MEDKEFYNELSEGDRFTKGIIFIILAIAAFALCLAIGINSVFWCIGHI